MSHRVSRYLHYAVLSGVCYELQRRWVDFLISIWRKFLKLLFYNMLEAGMNKNGKCLKLLFYNALEGGINKSNQLQVIYCDYYKNSKVFKRFYLLIGE